MRIHRPHVTKLLNELLVGTVLGLLILGGGGRVVMRAVAVATDRPLLLSVGGTVTVLAAGAAAGAVGGVLRAISRLVAQRSGRWSSAVRVLVFAVLLCLVTWRGLHGTPAGEAAWFWPLVLVYGVLLERVLRRPYFSDPSLPARSFAEATTLSAR